MSTRKPKPEKKRLAPNLTWQPDVEWMHYVSPVGLSICCGKLVVWLKSLDGAVPVMWWSWDGNPFFKAGRHKVHSSKCYEAYLESLPKKDGMFCLDEDDSSGDVPPTQALGEFDEVFVPYAEG